MTTTSYNAHSFARQMNQDFLSGYQSQSILKITSFITLNKYLFPLKVDVFRFWNICLKFFLI